MNQPERQPRSGKYQRISPEMDPLRLGSGWSVDDLDRTQILITVTRISRETMINAP